MMMRGNETTIKKKLSINLIKHLKASCMHMMMLFSLLLIVTFMTTMGIPMSEN
jgi:phosphate/sulfate permease